MPKIKYREADKSASNDRMRGFTRLGQEPIKLDFFEAAVA